MAERVRLCWLLLTPEVLECYFEIIRGKRCGFPSINIKGSSQIAHDSVALTSSHSFTILVFPNYHLSTHTFPVVHTNKSTTMAPLLIHFLSLLAIGTVATAAPATQGLPTTPHSVSIIYSRTKTFLFQLSCEIL